MKKISIAIAVLAAAALSSCVQEKSFEELSLGENGVAFALQNGATRAMEADSPVTKGATINLGRIGNQTLFLEETITDLEHYVPETKGSPAYTANVGDIYKNKLGVYVGNSYATFEQMDEELVDGGWRYRHVYAESPWPDEDTPVGFYFHMPSDMTSYGVTFATTDPHKAGKTSFSYISPTSATSQQDILFSYVEVSKSEHKDNLPKGTPVMLYHALSGIKFAIKNPADEREDLGIKVTQIALIGLMNKGDCVIEAGAEDLEDKVKWTASTVKADPEDNSMVQSFTYGNTDGVDKYVTTYAKKTGEEAGTDYFGSSFYDGGITQNINDEKASYTFWVIPQNPANNAKAKIRIMYDINGAQEYVEIPLNKIATQKWDAGQLRTFTFKVDDVNLKIEDTIEYPNTATQANAYATSYKDEVKITNTGNTDAFIRASLVGQWLDSATNTIVFGFRDNVNNLYLVESWYQDQFGNATGQAHHDHGEFVGLAGYTDTQTENPAHNAGTNPFKGWTLCTDGYYYFDSPVSPGGLTNPLFDSYTVKLAPKAIDPITLAELSGAAVYFTLEIATQAITAKDPSRVDGTNYSSWADAWEHATGTRPVKK